MINVLVGGKDRKVVLEQERKRLDDIAQEAKDSPSEPETNSHIKCEELSFTAQYGPATIPDLVRWASNQKIDGQPCVLQSAREHAYIRSLGFEFANGKYTQGTRTCALYFKEQDAFKVAYCDSPSKHLNIFLAGIDKKYIDADLTNPLLKIPKTDPMIAGMLDLAKREKRIFDILPTQSTGSFHVVSYPITQSGNADHLWDILRDKTSDYCGWLSAKNQTTIEIRAPTPYFLNHHGLDEHTVEVRVIELGGEDRNLNQINAFGRYNDLNRGHGVARIPSARSGNHGGGGGGGNGGGGGFSNPGTGNNPPSGPPINNGSHR